MKKGKINYPVKILLAVVAMAFTILGQAIQSKQFSAVAQSSVQVEDHSPREQDNEFDSIAEIRLHQFSLWNLFVNTAMAYIDPYGLSDKPIIYVYEFENQAEIQDALSQITTDDLYEPLVEHWFFGQVDVTQDTNDDTISIWRPVRLDTYDPNSPDQEHVQLFASNLPIPGEERADAYWVPYDEWLEFIN